MPAKGRREHRPTGRPVEGIDYVVCRHCRRAYRAITFTHLTRIHGYDVEHPILEYMARTGVRTAISLASLKRLVRSRAAVNERQGRHWTRERVGREILGLKSRGVFLNERSVQRRYSALWNAARRLQGSWARALTKAGIDPRTTRIRQRFSRREVIEAIDRRRREGRPLNSKSVRDSDLRLLGAAQARFGGWLEALRAAGVDPESVALMRNWSKDRILKSLRALGGPKRLTEVMERDSGLGAAALKEFGTWEAAMKAAGYDYSSRPPPRKWPRDTIISEIRRRKRLGLSLLDKDVLMEEGGLLKAGRREFGTWRAAVLAAGVPYPGRNRWPEERILEEIRSRRRRNLPVNAHAINHAAPGLYDAGKRIFGNWPAALRAAENHEMGR